MPDAVPLPSDTYEQKALGFIKEAISEGDAFLKSQEGFDKVSPSIDAIFNRSEDMKISKLSKTNANYLGKIVLDLASGMTDVRPFWEYRTHNHRFDRQADIYGRLSEHWWLSRNIDMRFVDAVKYVCAAGSAFIHLIWNPDIQDLDVVVEDPRDVIPIRPTSTMLLRDCMGVVVRREHTVHHILSQYPNADPNKVRAEKDGSLASSFKRKVGRVAELIGAPFFEWMKSNKASLQVPHIPTCELFTCYLQDSRTHEGSNPLLMGDFDAYGKEANSWSYTVQKGQKVYPNGRLIVATNYGILYDGPSPYWHGCVHPFPLVKMTLDPFPWTWLGKGVVWDLIPLQRTLDNLLRVFDDWAAQLAQPAVIADKNSVSRAELQKINSRAPGLKIRQNPMAGKGVQFQYPNPLPADFWKGIEFVINSMNELSGAVSVQALMRLNQMPASDTIERIADLMSPSIRLRSKVLEAVIREFATMLAYDFTQFYTLPMRLTVLGERGVTKEDFDFAPRDLMPDFIGSDLDEQGNILPAALNRGPRSRYDRSREIMRYLEFHVAPGSLLAASKTEKDMKYLQLFRMGAIDVWTMLDQFEIPNLGEAPAGTIMERLQMQHEAGMDPGVSSVGRKATAQQPPKQKSSGAISESG